MGILSTIFKSSDIVNAVIKSGDALVFTDEERAEVHLKQLEAYTPFKLVQRWMVMAVVPAYMVMVLILFGCTLAEIGDLEAAGGVLTGYVGFAFVSIITFYTGCGAAEGIVNKFKGK